VSEIVTRWIIAFCLTGIFGAAPAPGADVIARVGDVTRLKGQRVNRLVGMGLVVGLNGTGDGDEYAAAMRPLAEALKKFANPVQTLDELRDTRNVAIVWVTASTPDTGGREGERLEAQVAAFGAAKSLVGGRLLPTPLLFHDPSVSGPVYAIAAGRVESSDPQSPATGTIRGGATLEEDILVGYFAFGRELPYSNVWIEPDGRYITLVLDDAHAGWTLASEIAGAVSSELSDTAMVARVATAVDPKNVLVLLPEGQDPARWISDIQLTPLLMPSSEARVIANRRSGTIIVSGDAKISPVVVSKRGLTITVAPTDVTQPATEVVPMTRSFVAVDPSKSGGAYVSDLLEALNRLSVPVDDRIDILEEIHRQGKLHARLLCED
jgi:flagellar P-ring protein precursor FlgI